MVATTTTIPLGGVGPPRLTPHAHGFPHTFHTVVQALLSANRPAPRAKSLVRVAVHIRRGDIMVFQKALRFLPNRWLYNAIQFNHGVS
jgi:hypothetical protein